MKCPHCQMEIEEKTETKIMRQCDKCNFAGNESEFTYLGDSVYGCRCGSMRTHTLNII